MVSAALRQIPRPRNPTRTGQTGARRPADATKPWWPAYVGHHGDAPPRECTFRPDRHGPVPCRRFGPYPKEKKEAGPWPVAPMSAPQRSLHGHLPASAPLPCHGWWGCPLARAASALQRPPEHHLHANYPLLPRTFRLPVALPTAIKPAASLPFDLPVLPRILMSRSRQPTAISAAALALH